MEQIKKTNNRLAELQRIVIEANNSNAFIPIPRLKIIETVKTRLCNGGWTSWVRTSEFGVLKLKYRRAAYGYSLLIEPAAAYGGTK